MLCQSWKFANAVFRQFVMRLLIVANGFTQGGVSRVLSLLSKEWAKYHDVDVFFFKSADATYPLGGHIVNKQVKGRGCVWMQILSLYRFLRSQGDSYDRIIGFSFDANYPLILAASFVGLESRVVLSIHNPLQITSIKVRSRIKKWYTRAGKVVAVSNGIRQDLLALGLSDDRVYFIPNPVDINDIHQQSKCFVPKLWHSCHCHFVAVGRLHTYKGFDLLLQAFAQAVLIEPRLKLSIIGEGDQRQLLESLIAQFDLSSSVRLVGQVENPFAYMAQADVFVLSSRFEGWPMVLMEAMAMPLPVVAFGCTEGVLNIMDLGKAGCLLTCKDTKAMTDALIDLSQFPEKRSKLSKLAQRKIRQFDVSNVAGLWLD